MNLEADQCFESINSSLKFLYTLHPLLLWLKCIINIMPKNWPKFVRGHAFKEKLWIFFTFVLEPFFPNNFDEFHLQQNTKCFKKKKKRSGSSLMNVSIRPVCMYVCDCVFEFVCVYSWKIHIFLCYLYGWTVRMRRIPMCMAWLLASSFFYLRISFFSFHPVKWIDSLFIYATALHIPSFNIIPFIVPSIWWSLSLSFSPSVFE